MVAAPGYGLGEEVGEVVEGDEVPGEVGYGLGVVFDYGTYIDLGVDVVEEVVGDVVAAFAVA